MATDSIVGGLFGMTPESYQDTRQLLEQRQALAQAQLDPYQAVNYMAARAGQQLGRGIGGLLGAEDPQLKLISTRNALAKQFDVNTPEGLAQYGQALRQSGDVQGALQATTLANQLTQTQAQTSLTQEKLASSRLAGQREQILQTALSELPQDPSEQQILGVLRRFGDPKTVLVALERKTAIDAQLAEKKRIENEKLEFRREQIEKDQTFKETMLRLEASLKSSTTSLQQQLIQEKIDALRQKKQDAIDKQLGSAEGVVDNTKVVLDKVVEAEKLIGAKTTGFGSYLSVVPGTDARQLASVISTIKARLGFDQLQQMRNSSPTGGALGQVSNRELASLESAVASLDQGLEPKALRENLKQIRDSYSRWQESALGRLPAERQRPDVVAPSSNIVDFNKLK